MASEKSGTTRQRTPDIYYMETLECGDPLLPSGLVGPVYMRVGHVWPIEGN